MKCQTSSFQKKKPLQMNSDGIINASDASAILSYYAFLSTGGEDSIKDFLNTP